MSGSGETSGTVCSLRFFFLIKNVGEAYGDLDSLMKFFPRFLSIHPLRNSVSLILYWIYFA